MISVSIWCPGNTVFLYKMNWREPNFIFIIWKTFYVINIVYSPKMFARSHQWHYVGTEFSLWWYIWFNKFLSYSNIYIFFLHLILLCVFYGLIHFLYDGNIFNIVLIIRFPFCDLMSVGLSVITSFITDNSTSWMCAHAYVYFSFSWFIFLLYLFYGIFFQ